MSRTTLTLKNFIQPVPICKQSANPEAVLTTLGSGQYEAIAIVSEEQYPLGAIACRRLLPYLIKQLRSSRAEPINSNLPPQEPENLLSLIDLNTLIEPIVSLSAEMSVKEFCSWLETGDKNHTSEVLYALVDSSHKFLGFLDTWSLLKSYLTNAGAFGLNLPDNSLQSLLPLLERLPLPLRLETARGQTLYQNLTWQEQIGLPHCLKEDSHFSLQQGSRQAQELTPNIPPQLQQISDQTKQEALNLAVQVNSEAVSLCQQPIKASVGQAEEKPIMSPTGSNSPSRARQKPTSQRIWQFTKLPLEISTDWKQQEGKTENINTDTDREFRASENQLPLASATQIASPASSRENLSVNPRNRDNSSKTWKILPRDTANSEDSLARLAFNSTSFDRQQISVKLDRQQRPPIWLVVAMDVTQQQQTYQKLAAKNADLIQVNRLKEEFLASISHEIKSPLTGIVGLSSLLQEQKLGQLNQRQARYVEQIYQSSRQLINLVNPLLDLTALETGRLKITPKLVNIKNICQRAYQSIQQKYQDKINSQIQLTLEIEPSLETVVADELRLHQMLFNLLENAVRLTETGGEVSLRVNTWQNWIAFTVWDTGIGIAEESQHSLFEQLHQVGTSRQGELPTTSLALMLTQRLAKAHGGDVSFISRVGQGSKFTLLLPRRVNNEQMETTKTNSLTQPTTTARLVLIVEAVPGYIENIASKLILFGYQVVIARSGTEALEKARQLQPFAILLNPVLPLLSGWDVLAILKSDDRTKKIPIIVTSIARDKKLSRENGANGFLSLPVKEEVLQEVLLDLQDLRSPHTRNLTILCLHPDAEKIGWVAAMINSQLSGLNYRILEADSLQQAEIVARIWKIDVVVLDSTLPQEPLSYLRSLSECDSLAALPLVTWDAKTTEAANQVKGLSVFPCLVPVKERNFTHFLQAIQIAAKIRD